MRSLRFLAALFILAVPLAQAAPDANGYSAAYECRAGGPHCGVDVAALAAQTCDQIVRRTDRDWSRIIDNQSDNVFCIEPGDHASKGTLTITFSGSASRYKVLRYYRSGDTDDEPWRQDAAERAQISRVRFAGSNYWLVHRLTVDPNFASSSFAIHLDGSSHIIVSRVLAQHGAKQVYVQGARDSVIQNSVLRESIKTRGIDSDGVGMGYRPTRIYIVNNEIYRIHSHGIYIDPNSDCAGCVIENNDVYVDSRVQYTDCRGNYTTDPNAPCSDAEAGISLKSGGSSSSQHLEVVQNRMWGHRRTDTSVCCISGGQGTGMTLSSSDINDPGAHHVLLLNNIVSHTQHAVVTPREGPKNNSIIGNLFYGIKDYYAPNGNIGSWALSSLGHWDYNEVYLNTVIDADSWGNLGSGNSALDVKCNAIIAAGPATGGTPDGSSVVSHNAFFGTSEFTTEHGTNVTRQLTTRSNSTLYASGSIVRFEPVDNCRTGGETACFLYHALNTGTSGASKPHACAQLGCEFSDGEVTWKASRGPYVYKRKLRTVPGGERAVVPYAQVHKSAPEVRSCDASIGSSGRGVHDEPVL